MLDLLRKNSRSFGVYLMFAIIIVVFAFTFGAITPDQACAGAQGPGQVHDLARVDGEVIDTNHLYLASALTTTPPPPNSKNPNAEQMMMLYVHYRFDRLRLADTFGVHAFGPEPMTISPIKEEKIMEDLMETRIVANYARKLGMTITTREVNGRLAPLLDSFRDETTGQFEQDAWISWVRNQLHSSPLAFEHFVKDELLRERMIHLLVGGVEATDPEVEAFHRMTQDAVKIEYVTLDKDSVRPMVPVSEADVAQWLADNEERVAEEYDKRLHTEFTVPKRWTLRVIKLEAFDPDGMPGDPEPEIEELLRAQWDDAKAQADRLREELVAAFEGAVPDADGADGEHESTPLRAAAFASLAEEHSAHASREAGGALDGPRSAAELGAPPFGPALRAAVEGLGAGDLSGVVTTRDGFWILWAEAVTDETVRSLDEVRADLARSIVQQERAADFVATVADALHAAATANQDKPLAEVVDELHARYPVAADAKRLEVRESPAFPLARDPGQGRPPTLPFLIGVGHSGELVRAAFMATPESPVIDEVVEVPARDARVVARLLERVEAEPLDDEAREDLREQLTFHQRRRLYRGWYETLRDRMEAEGKIRYTREYQQIRQQAREAYRSAGGVLPEDMAAATPSP